MQTNPTTTLESKKWPDFYAILKAQPELDHDALRRVISERYQEASNKMDHRDLSIRFYNQLLTQKVLPTCRRILLNPEMRVLYDEQLRLHREDSVDAISYHKFVVEVTKTKSTCLLDANELSILPSISGKASHDPLQALHVPGEPQRFHPNTGNSAASVGPGMPSATQSESAKKPLPIAAIAGVAVLLLGAGGWFMTRSAPATPDVVTATPIAAPALAMPQNVVGLAGKVKVSSLQDEHPADLTMDGKDDTFWVSDGTKAGQGPTEAKPQWIQIQLDKPQIASTMRIVGRAGYGPKSGEIQVSDDGESFRKIAAFSANDGEPATVKFEPTNGTFFRVLITSAYDVGSEDGARNVQVCEISLIK